MVVTHTLSLRLRAIAPLSLPFFVIAPRAPSPRMKLQSGSVSISRHQIFQSTGVRTAGTCFIIQCSLPPAPPPPSFAHKGKVYRIQKFNILPSDYCFVDIKEDTFEKSLLDCFTALQTESAFPSHLEAAVLSVLADPQAVSPPSSPSGARTLSFYSPCSSLSSVSTSLSSSLSSLAFLLYFVLFLLSLLLPLLSLFSFSLLFFLLPSHTLLLLHFIYYSRLLTLPSQAS